MKNVTSVYNVSSLNESFISEWEKYGNVTLPLRYLRMCLGIAITITNGIFLLTYTIRPSSRKNIRPFVVNLAVVDVQNGFLILPLLAVFPRIPQGFLTTQGMCTFISDWSMTLFCVAHLSHLLVTIDRFVSIYKPLRHPEILTTKVCLILIGNIWFFGVVFAFWPSFGLPRYKGIPYNISCGGAVAISATYLFIFIYGVLAIPLVADVLMYLYMLSVAKRHAGAIAQLATLGANTEEGRLTKREQNKAMRTTLMSTGLFLLAWLPFLLLFQIMSLCSTIYSCAQIDRGMLSILSIIFSTMAYSNSMINPLLFAIRDPIMRGKIRSLFCPCLLRRDSRRVDVSVQLSQDTGGRISNVTGIPLY